MSRKSPSQLKILNDTLDLMTLMTHCSLSSICSPCCEAGRWREGEKGIGVTNATPISLSEDIRISSYLPFYAGRDRG
jgi:hypothetical protein